MNNISSSYCMDVVQHQIPLSMLPSSVLYRRGMGQGSLDKYRPSMPQYGYIHHLIVTCWALKKPAEGIQTLQSFLSAMWSLVKASHSQQLKRRLKRQRRFLRQRQENRQRQVEEEPEEEKEEEEPEEEIDDEEEEYHEQLEEADLGRRVCDGEHRFLKSLSHETFHLHLESIFVCAVASSFRVAPRRATTHSPYEEILLCLSLLENCMRIYVDAERNGFLLPMKT
jgi:hypothetical protein